MAVVTDTIADMLTRIRNANQMRYVEVRVPSSNIKKEIARILKAEGYISDFKVNENNLMTLNLKYSEGKKERVQAFEGLVVNKNGGGISETFTVRKKSGGVGVERIFPVNAPTIESIVVVKKGLVRRANLSFIKNMKKDYKVKERN